MVRRKTVPLREQRIAPSKIDIILHADRAGQALGAIERETHYGGPTLKGLEIASFLYNAVEQSGHNPDQSHEMIEADEAPHEKLNFFESSVALQRQWQIWIRKLIAVAPVSRGAFGCVANLSTCQRTFELEGELKHSWQRYKGPILQLYGLG